MGSSFRVVLAVAIVLASALGVRAEDAPPGPWEIDFGTKIGFPAGFVKVGENDRSGDLLRFHSDLGIDAFETIQTDGVYHLTPHDSLRLGFEYTFLYGGKTLDQDIAFNGATLAAGTHLRTEPIFGRLTGFYDHEFVSRSDGLNVGGGVGLTYVYLDFRLHGTLAANTVGHETKEDFYAQELPVPLLLVHGDYPLRERLMATGWVDGGFLPRVDSLRTEGGQVTLTQGHADVFLGLRYLLTPGLTVQGGYSFTYFAQHEKSGEDNNEILLLGHGLGLNFAYRF